MAEGPDFRSRLFHAWFLLSRPMTLGVRALATDSGGRVLLVRHTYIAGWHLPGGGVEKGQTVYEALARELREEANAEFAGEPVLQSVHLNRKVTRRDHVVVFRCREAWQVTPKSRDLEIIAAEFFDPDALPEGIAASSARRIAEYRGLEPVDPYW